MLIESAILVGNAVYTGHRHFNIFKEYKNIKGLKYGTQGFIDKNGKFYNRKDALKYALEIGQIENKEYLINSSVLTSEDLW
jgi:hypothetical protein